MDLYFYFKRIRPSWESSTAHDDEIWVRANELAGIALSELDTRLSAVEIYDEAADYVAI